MKSVLAVSIFLAACGAASAQQAEAKDKGSKPNYGELVKRLVSPNKPIRIDNAASHRLVFPSGYDKEAQAPIEKNRRILYEHCEEALPFLIEGCADTRYSLTWQSDSYCGNECVGEVCLEIVASHLEVYREHMSLRDKISYYAYSFVPRMSGAIGEQVTEEKRKEIKEWWQARKGKTLLELQIEAFDWAIEKRKKEAETSEERDATTEIGRLVAVRDKLKKNGKCLPPLHIPASVGGFGQEATSLAKPTQQQYLWHEQERIAFVCLDPCTWQGRDYDDHSTKLADMKLEKLDAEQWIAAAKSWGAKEILLVCKHTGGFCWWPTDTTDYCVKNIAWKNGKGNLVGEVADACRRNGLKIGVYIYPDDPKYMANIGRGGRTDDPNKQPEWNIKLRKQWEEVLTICGSDLIQEIWFDGSCVVPLDDILQKLAPRAVILQSPLADLRWVGNEAGYARDPNWNTLRAADLKSGVATEAHSTPDGDAWAPVECDTTLYDHYWFWSERAEKNSCKSLDKLMDIFVHSAGHGSVLLLNSTPNTEGLIPKRDTALYKQFGETIAREFGRPLASVAEKTGSTVELDLNVPQAVNCVDLWEDYRQGHRIREYTVEARVDGHWRKVAEGTAVGRRKIDIFPEVRADRLRVNVAKSVGTPLFRQVTAHRVSAELAARCGMPISVARHAGATASSVHSAPYEARYINDGDRGTRWGAKDDDPLSWVEYDLGQPRRFAATAIAELADRVQSFVIEARNSADGPWRTIYTGTTLGNDFRAKLPATTARYVRLRITKLKELSATIWEWDLFDDAGDWELVAEKHLPDGGDTLDVDLSAQVPVPGQYVIHLDGAEAAIVRPLFEGQLGEDRFIEKIDLSTYHLNRTQAVDGRSATGVRLSFKPGTVGTVKILVRPQ